MIKEVKMFTVICDRCGKDVCKDDDYSCWSDSDFALDIATEKGWQEIECKHYCNDCWKWNEDETEMIVKN